MKHQRFSLAQLDEYILFELSQIAEVWGEASFLPLDEVNITVLTRSFSSADGPVLEFAQDTHTTTQRYHYYFRNHPRHFARAAITEQEK